MDHSETDARKFSARTRTDSDLAAVARDLVLAMMSCASTQDIAPVQWWPRAKAALMAACDRATSWGALVTAMADKLEIDVVRLDVAREICGNRLSDDDLRALKRVVRNEAVYIVAEAAAIREQQRKMREEQGA